MMKESTFAEMERARLAHDGSYDGIFWVGVRTMKVFCLPSCRAKQPLAKNVVYFVSYEEAVQAGYRPCRRCRPPVPGHQSSDGTRPVESPQRQASLPLMPPPAPEQGARHESSAGRRAKGAEVILTEVLPSPLGDLVVGATEHGLCLLEYADRDCLPSQIATLEKLFGCRALAGSNEYLERIKCELARYFAGELIRFETPLEIAGTPFERAVWACLGRIPYGKTSSYSEIAQQVGRPGAQRAVGRANGSNKVAIVIPCHRVVEASGTLRGYGGGLWRKQFLLDLERRHAVLLLA